MSTEEDLELRDLVTQALENNGVLSKIRAELRASVFLALEDQDLLQTETSYANKAFKNFIKTSEGIFLTQLVREFLEYFELDFTLSVFDPETSYGKDYEYLGRNSLLKQLKIKNAKDGPLLAQILKQTNKCNEEGKEMLNPAKEELENSHSVNPDEDKIILKKNVKNCQISSNADDRNAVSGDQTKTKDKETSEKLNAQGDTLTHNAAHNETRISAKKNENSTKTSKQGSEEKKKGNLQEDIQTRDEINSTSDLMSLSNLPPLLNNTKTTPEGLPPVPNSRKEMNQLKTMMSSLDVTESNYDEDFQSSPSGSGLEGRSGKNSAPESESEEIEEDINSGIDDLLSNASGLEDLTVDVSVSNTSGLGDYMENI